MACSEQCGIVCVAVFLSCPCVYMCIYLQAFFHACICVWMHATILMQCTFFSFSVKLRETQAWKADCRWQVWKTWYRVEGYNGILVCSISPVNEVSVVPFNAVLNELGLLLVGWKRLIETGKRDTGAGKDWPCCEENWFRNTAESKTKWTERSPG